MPFLSPLSAVEKRLCVELIYAAGEDKDSTARDMATRLETKVATRSDCSLPPPALTFCSECPLSLPTAIATTTIASHHHHLPPV